MGTVRCHPNLHGVTRRSLLSSEMDDYAASAEQQHAPTTRIIFPSWTEPFIHCIDRGEAVDHCTDLWKMTAAGRVRSLFVRRSCVVRITVILSSSTGLNGDGGYDLQLKRACQEHGR